MASPAVQVKCREVQVLITELKVCSNIRNLRRGKEIHGVASENGNASCLYVGTALVDMYAKCGSMHDARQAFESIKKPDVVAWNALLLGYAKNGEGVEALDLFARMQDQGFAPDSITFVAILKACTSLEDRSGLNRGKQIHLAIFCQSNVYVQNALIDMYAKCGSMVDARLVFNIMKHPDVVSWNTLILGYAENGQSYAAFDMFSNMRTEGISPDSITFRTVLKACTYLALEQDGNGKAGCLERGKKIHLEAVCCCCLDILVLNTLIDMYANCGHVFGARQVFDYICHPDVVSWTALILGYAENGEATTALRLFARMRSQGCAPDAVTFMAALKACGLLGALETGSKIHADIKVGTGCNVKLVTCLVDFYAKCGSLVEAQRVFDSYHKTRDQRTWTALLAGYSHLGDSKAVFGLLERMKDAGCLPNGVTFLCILTCCSHAGLVEKAVEFFNDMFIHYAIAATTEHYNCMLDILCRSNKLDDGMALLRKMPWKPDVVTWLTVLPSCHKWKNVGTGKLAFESLVSPNASAYVLMAHIYGSKCMWKEQELMLRMREQLKTRKEPGQSCWTNELGNVHVFSVD